MKKLPVMTASFSAMAASLVTIVISKILVHYEIGMGDDFYSLLPAFLAVGLHYLFAKWGVEAPDETHAPP